MDAPEELASLIADTLAELDAWRLTGATLVPWAAPSAVNADLAAAPRVALAPGSPRPPGGGTREPPPLRPPPARPDPAAFAIPRPKVPDSPASRVEGSPSQGARPVASQVQPSAPPAPTTPPAARPTEPVREAPVSGAGLFGAAPTAGAGLFGAKWTAALRDRGAEIESWLGAQPPCPRCGRPALERGGRGSADARLVIVASSPEGGPMSPDGSAMLDKMLVHVLALERADAWVIEANPCSVTHAAGCRAAVLHQITVLGPRVILGMGAVSPLGPPRRGEWARFGEVDLFSTFHPHELAARPADKRAAMDHLTELRRRL